MVKDNFEIISVLEIYLKTGERNYVYFDSEVRKFPCLVIDRHEYLSKFYERRLVYNFDDFTVGEMKAAIYDKCIRENKWMYSSQFEGYDKISYIYFDQEAVEC